MTRQRIPLYLLTTLCSLCPFDAGWAADGPAPPKEELRYDGKPFEYWRNYLRTELKAERRIDGIRAMAAFGTKGYASEAATVIAELLRDFGVESYQFSEKPSEANKVVEEAAGAMIRIGMPAFDVLATNASSENIRTFFGYAVYKLDDRKAIPLSEGASRSLLQAALGDEPELRKFAVWMLGLGMRRDKKLKEDTVAKVIEGKQVERFVRAVVQALDSKSDSLELQSILAALGPRAKGAVPALVKMRLKNKWALWYDLRELGADPVRLAPLIAEGLRNDDSEVRINACNWLGELGSDAASAVPALSQQLKSSDNDVRLATIATLGLIGAKAKSAVSILLATATREDEASGVKAAAIDALEKIGVEAPKILPLLIKILDEETQDNRSVSGLARCALLWLVKLDAEPKRTVAILTRTLKFSAYLEDALLIAEALGKMGPGAVEALPVLREAAQSGDRRLRLAASKAIQKITGK